MKAIVYSKKGTPDKLSLRKIDKPVPKDNEVLIRVYVVSLNAADYRSMKMGLIPEKKIFGADVAGIIESVGKDITVFKPGDAVLGELADHGFGGLAEYVTAPLLWFKKDEVTISKSEQTRSGIPCHPP
jgi:NADPH:quinone reductase-like Zn-dependent oxidoreductase